VDPVPDPLLLRKSGSAGDRTRDLCICSQKLWPLDHRGGLFFSYTAVYLTMTVFLSINITDSLRLYPSTPIDQYFSRWKSAHSHPLYLSTHKSYAGFEHLLRVPLCSHFIGQLSLSLPVGSLIHNFHMQWKKCLIDLKGNISITLKHIQ